MMVTEKSRETRLRRIAERQGLRLGKSRTRDPRALDYGLWTITDPLGVDRARAGMTLDEVEEYLNERPAATAARLEVERIAQRILDENPGISADELRKSIMREILKPLDDVARRLTRGR